MTWLSAGDGRLRLVASGGSGGKALALNAGVGAALEDVVVFADTHQRFRRDTSPNLPTAFGDSRPGAGTGSLQLADGGPLS